MSRLPLEGLTVLDMSQFLAGPAATLRLADMGARVIKIERPIVGDLSRQVYVSNFEMDGDSSLFHTINRRKESFAADLKCERGREQLTGLIKHADVLVQNFRPGVIDRLGFSYDAVKAINPRIVYGSVTGYGTKGPWRDKPGQDLLAQCLSGLTWLNGNQSDPPVPVGLSVVDLFTGSHLVQGILACLIRRGITGEGGHVEVSLLESALDMQFELLTTHMNDGGQSPCRSASNSGHAYLAAPYGIYQTADGYIGLAMCDLPHVGELIGLDALSQFKDPATWFDHRDEIKKLLADYLRTQPTRHWLDILESADVWCADVLSWSKLLEHDAFAALDMVQRIDRGPGMSIDTTRCPIRIDNAISKSNVAAPRVGEHTKALCEEFGLACVSNDEIAQPPDTSRIVGGRPDAVEARSAIG
jgi:crotonobetainyl-CoA:carnitine CoA-transferase CaiB-like acyl-CoA transferase